MTATANETWPRTRRLARSELRLTGAEALRERTEEQKIIRDLLSRARSGCGGVILVESEPGMGKSGLLRWAAGAAADLAFSSVSGAADQLTREIPLAASRTTQPWPFVATPADRQRQSDRAAWWTSQLSACLEQQAAASPVLVCLDDLHWASPATLAAVRVLTQGLTRQPVVWILARCTAVGGDAEHLFRLLQTDGAARLGLSPLSEDAAASLLTDRLGAPPDQGLLDLAGEAAGNPLLLTELAGGLADEDAVQLSGDRAVLVSARLPERMRAIAEARLAALSERGWHLAVAGAVLGPSFQLEDAAEMLNENPSTLLPTLREVMRAGLVTAADNTLSFRHQLLARAVGDTVPRPMRMALHRQYGQILLGRGTSATLAAGHLLQAARSSDSVSVADLDTAAAQILPLVPRAAADLALRAFELTPAADPGVLSRLATAAEALAAAGRLDQAARTAQHALARPLPPVTEARLRIALSSVLCARGQVQDAVAETTLAMAQAELPPDLRDQAMAAHLQALTASRDKLAGPTAGLILADPGQHGDQAVVSALIARAAFIWDHGGVSAALTLLREAARQDAGISPDARHPQPLLVLAAALIDLRQLDEAGKVLHAVDSQALRGIPAQAALPILHARIHLAEGRFAAAVDAGQEALTIAAALAAEGYAVTAHGVLALIALRRGDITAAVRHADHLPAATPQLPGPYAPAEIALVHAQISQVQEGPSATLGLLHCICTSLPASQAVLLGEPTVAAWLVRTALAAGESELASFVASSAGTLAIANPGYPAVTAAAAHSLGLSRQDPVHLAEAVRQHPDPWSQASALEDLGVLHTEQADPGQAVNHLSRALEGYQRIGAAADAARVRLRLRKLGVRRRHWVQSAHRPVTGWESLTDTERTASELVAQGLNNRQIASRMYVSVSTVAAHMRQIFRKLGIGSRVELARIVIERTQQPGGPHRQD